MAERRNTIQQEIVAQTLRGMEGHPTADAVYIEICNRHSSIGRATVFRILNRMVEEGQLRRVSGVGADRFDCFMEPHCHVRCKSCGRIDDVRMKRFPKPEQDVEYANGYVITGHSLLFEGICEACTKETENVEDNR